MKIEQIFVNTINQKILKFLANNPEKVYFDSEIAKNIDISVGACNQSLKELLSLGLVLLEKKGRMNFYQLNNENFLAKQFKIFLKVLEISSLLDKIKKISIKIVLFGSSSRGENISDSDIDLFILSRQKESIVESIKRMPKNVNIKAIIKTPSELVAMETNDPVFAKEIKMGIKLWEEKDE